jgi:hypothetical protein
MAGGTIDHVFNVASVAVILNDVPRNDQLACAVLQVSTDSRWSDYLGLLVKQNSESDVNPDYS